MTDDRRRNGKYEMCYQVTIPDRREQFKSMSDDARIIGVMRDERALTTQMSSFRTRFNRKYDCMRVTNMGITMLIHR
jgi:hypothetical protein